jgi:hypothetical protein
MANYYTDQEKDKIREWLIELRVIVTPIDLPTHRDRARELVRQLDRISVEPTCVIALEFRRVRRIWRRLAAQAE